MPSPACICSNLVKPGQTEPDTCSSIITKDAPPRCPKEILPIGLDKNCREEQFRRELEMKELKAQVQTCTELLEQCRRTDNERRREVEDAQARLRLEEERTAMLQAEVTRLSGASEEEDAAPARRGDKRTETLKIIKDVGKRANDASTALTDEELLAAFLGCPAGASSSGSLPGIERGGCPRGQPRSEQFCWILACGLPDPVRGPLGRRYNCIRRKEAESIFDKCFKGESRNGSSIQIQAKNFVQEKAAFLSAFERLPPAEKGLSGKRFMGEEPAESTWHASKPLGVRVQNFMELLLNVVVTKLTIHCQLTCRTCSTEDLKTVLVLLTCTTQDLLVEADAQAFPTELASEVVDPMMLEPCTPKTYFPLLHWFLTEQPPEHESDELLLIAKQVIAKVKAAPNEHLIKYQKEASFWLQMDEYIDNFIHQMSIVQSKKLLQSSISKGTSDGEEQDGFWRCCRRATAKAKEDEHLDPRDHIGKEDYVSELKAAFAVYLREKAKHGLGNSRAIMEKVNAMLPSHVQLQNLLDCIGVPVMNPYMEFHFVSHGPDDHRSYIWQMHEAISRAGTPMLTPFDVNERIKLTRYIIERHVDLHGLEHLDLIKAVFPLDSREKAVTLDGSPSSLASNWGIPTEHMTLKQKAYHFLSTMRTPPPLDDIKAYYGERIALYHALMQHLRSWLRIPAVVGFLAFIMQLLFPFDPKDTVRPPMRVFFDLFYAATVAVWSTLMLESWKRKEIGYAARWGMRGIEGGKHPPRPKYWGIVRRSPVHDDREIEFPAIRRLPRQIFSYMILFILAACEMMIIFYIEYFRGTWQRHDGKQLNDEGEVMEAWPVHQWAFVFTGCIVASIMYIFSQAGEALSMKLNEFENYETHIQFMDQLVAKAFIFEFLNRFNLYFYMAFLKGYLEGCLVWTIKGTSLDRDRNGKMCLLELQMQLRMVFLVEMLKNVVEVFGPVIRRVRALRQSSPCVLAADMDTGCVRMSHVAQLAMEKEPYGTSEVDGTFDDYKEIMILFGYITMFSVVFPLAPFLGAIVLQVESRVDGFKLYEVVRRPYPSSAESIGSWFRILDVMSWISMVSNSALVTFTFGHFDNPPGYFGESDRLSFFLLLVGTLVCLKLKCAVLVPDVPENVQTWEQHQEWVQRCIHREERQKDKEPVDIGALDLVVDRPDTGELRDPIEFGVSKQQVRQRLARLLQVHGDGILSGTQIAPKGPKTASSNPLSRIDVLNRIAIA